MVGRLISNLRLTLDSSCIRIQCDNTRTISLLTDEVSTLRTALRHVDIHRHWLRQEVQNGVIDLRWVSTDQMPADGLTKALSRTQFEAFRQQVHLTDLEEQIRLQAD